MYNTSIKFSKEYLALKEELRAKIIEDSKNTEWIDFTSPATEQELKEMEMDDRIDMYIHGEMTTKEELAFLEDCKNDPELKSRAVATAYLVKGLKSLKDKEEL